MCLINVDSGNMVKPDLWTIFAGPNFLNVFCLVNMETAYGQWTVH